MKSRLLIVGALLCATWFGQQHAMPAGWFPLAATNSGGGGYTGPGDVVSGATAWWGLRGYNSAFSGNVATICDVATGSTCANATWSAGVLTLPNIGGSPCNVVACNVSELFDQTGNGNHVVQATNSKRPALTVSCVNALPCAVFNGSTSILTSAATIGTLAQPNTITAVVIRTGAFTSNGGWFGDGSGANAVAFYHAASTLFAHAGSGTPTCGTGTVPADSAWHSITYVMNGTSSLCNYDNTSTSANGVGTTAISGTANLGHEDSFASSLTGDLTEVGVWNIGFSTTQQTNICHNQYLYWATSVAC